MPEILSLEDVASVLPGGPNPPLPALATRSPAPLKAGLQLSDVASVEEAPAAPAGLSLSDIASVSPDTSQLDAVRGKSVEELVADKDFSPVNFLQQNKDFASQDPEFIAKVTEVYKQKEQAGTSSFDKAKAIVTGVPVVAKALGKGVASAAEKVYSLNPFALLARAAGAASTGIPGAVQAEGKRALGEAAEVPLSVEAAVAGSSDLLRRSGRAVRDIAGIEQGKKAELTPEQWRNRLFDDVAGADQAVKAGEGNAAVASAIGVSADELKKEGITVNPATIQELSAITDPVNFIPIGGAIGIIGKFGGKLGTRILGQALNPAQAAKAAELLNAARNAASGLTSGGLKLAGKGIEKTGNVIEGITGGLTGKSVVGGIGIGHLVGLSGTQIGAILGAGKALQLTGKGITGAGKIIAGETAAPAALALAGRVGSEVAKGVAEGGILAIPFELGARPEEEQAILGGAGLAGAIRGAGPIAAAAGRGAQNALATQIFKVVEQRAAPESATYGTEPNLDAIHETAKAALDSRSQKLVDWSRELFRDAGVEIYTLDEANFKREVPGANARGFKVTIGETIDPTGAPKPLVRIMLNADAEAVPHELFHALTEVDPVAAKDLIDTVSKDMTPEQKDSFKQYYESLLNEGRPEGSPSYRRLAPEKVAEEVAAEVFSRTYLAQDLSKVAAPITQKAALFASRILEKVGVPLGQLGAKEGAPGVSNLGIRPSAAQATKTGNYLTGLLGRLQEDGTLAPATKSKILSNLSPEDLRKSVTTAAPVAPAEIVPPGPPPIAPRAPGVRPVPGPEGPRNIRVTREEQNNFAQRRAEDTGIDRVRTAAEKESPETQARVNEISTLLEQGNPPLEVVHAGVETTSGVGEPAGRTQRRSEQEAAYIAEGLGDAPESVRDTYQKVTVPVRWEVVGGKAQLLAMSLDKVIANVSRLVKDLVAAKKESSLPYEILGGKLTDQSWKEIIGDIQNYTENQSNGFRGDGQKLVRPKTDIGASLPAENPAYNPVQIPEDRTNAINLLMGLATPLTAREVKGAIAPGNVKGQILSELQGRQPAVPEGIRAKDVGKQTFKSGRTLKETNPLRNELVKAGVPVRELLDVTERINARDIQSVIPRPDIDFRAPVTDIIRAGFLPGPEVRSFQDELNAIKTGAVQGQTFNVDGSVFDPGSRKLDIVTLASVNVPARELSPARVQTALAPYAELLAHPDVKPGLFRLADGENVSVDINAVVDQSHRKNTAKFARDNNQESFFDLNKGETVDSGGDGNTRLTDVTSLSSALDDLTAGKPVDVAALSKSGTESFLPKTQQEVLDNLTSRARMSDPRLTERLIPMEEFNRIQAERKAAVPIEPTVDQLFLPASALPDDVDPIVQAAVRTPKGRVFTGSWHGEALTKLADAVGDGTLGEPISARAQAAAAEDAFGLAGFGVDGFVTKSGKFLNREEAFQHAKRIEQLKENAEGYLLNQGTLESKEFAQNRQFQPKEFTAKDLEKLEKYNVKKTEVKKNTGWIFPNSEFVPLDTNFHEQYLAENAANLNEKFGTDFSKTASVDDRLKALNQGFVRFRYDQNGGSLVIEANASKWASVKRAALNKVLDSISSIDKVKISLLNDKGQVVDSSSARLFDAERPEDEVQTAFSELRPNGRRESFLPKVKPTPKSEISLEKGWISPGGDFHPLGDFATHTEWANKALDGTKTGDASQGMQELGWARFTPIYDGSVTVENLTGKPLSTLQRRALKNWAIEQPELKSLEFDNGKDRPEIIQSENDKSFLPKVKPTPEALKKQRDTEVKAYRKEVRENFPEAIIPEYAQDENGKVRLSPASGQPLWKKVPYRFEESPVAEAAVKGITDPKERTEAAANAIADNMAKHAAEALKDPAIEAGKDWYNLARTKLGKVFGDDAGFFSELLGATSAQTPVPENFKQSLDAYNLFKAGKYDDIIAKYREGKARWDEGTIEDFVADTGNEKPLRNQYLAWWIDKNNLKPKRSNDKLFNANSLPVLRVLDRSWKQEVQGPKTPNFADNLSGASDKATIDVWAARAVARAGNEGNPNRWRLVNASEGGVSDKDFFFGQDVFQKAADKVGMKPHELQALLWFAEKDRWAKNGWTSKVGEEKSDFNYFLDKTSRSPTGELVIEKKAAPQLDLALKADDLTKK